MPFIQAPTSPTHELSGASFTSLATPSRGSTESCVWLVSVHPGAPGAVHTVTREEVFLARSGRGVATVDGERMELAEGDVLVLPADTPFSLEALGDEPFEAVAVLPVGGQACLPGGAPFTPPWAA